MEETTFPAAELDEAEAEALAVVVAAAELVAV
jgi:hypothetical protein